MGCAPRVWLRRGQRAPRVWLRRGQRAPERLGLAKCSVLYSPLIAPHSGCCWWNCNAQPHPRLPAIVGEWPPFDVLEVLRSHKGETWSAFKRRVIRAEQAALDELGDARSNFSPTAGRPRDEDCAKSGRCGGEEDHAMGWRAAGTTPPCLAHQRANASVRICPTIVV